MNYDFIKHLEGAKQASEDLEKKLISLYTTELCKDGSDMQKLVGAFFELNVEMKEMIKQLKRLYEKSQTDNDIDAD